MVSTSARPPEASPAPSTRLPSDTENLAYDAFFGGALGGSVIALFFLVLDSVQGSPLSTPSLIGTALFTGAPPAAIGGVRLDMVALYSLVHFTVFGGLAAGISRLCRWSPMVDRHPLIVGLVVFVILTGALLVADWTVMNGVIVAIGTGRVVVGNALAGLAMALFMRRSHRTA